jgi:hypothetical protein
MGCPVVDRTDRQPCGLHAAEAGLDDHHRLIPEPYVLGRERLIVGQEDIIGSPYMLWEYRNMSAVAWKLDPQGMHDACYLPRGIHVTGDIDIHELAWARDDALWLVNTRFSCLYMLDADASFTHRCRPPFVTALGETDTPEGWRAHKADGGVLLDVPHNAAFLHGLSMPHSLRWYRGRLWVLESGHGRLAVVDAAAGTCPTVAQLPGYTWGLDFAGPLAFVGLSQVREHTVFSGIPLVEQLAEHACGVWVIHIETGATVGFVRFEAGVQEIFAVHVLHGIQFPEVLAWDDAHLSHSYMLPDAALAEVPPLDETAAAAAENRVGADAPTTRGEP